MAHRWKVLLVTSIGVLVSSLDLFIVNIAFPDIARDFSGTTLDDLSWVLNAYAIVFGALLVPAGRIADRVGRKRAFLVGMTIFTIASALCAAAPSVELLVAARVLQAAGGAFLLPSTLGLVLPAFPPEQRAVAVGVWSAAGGVGAALGPPVGGLLVELSWHWVFLVNLPIGIATVIAGSRILSEIREPRLGPRPDVLGALALAASMALLTTGIVKGQGWGWTDARILAAFTSSALLLGGFLARSARHPAPVIELDLLRLRPFAAANLSGLIFFAGFGAFTLAGVELFTQVWGYSTVKAGLALAPGALMAAAAAMFAGRLAGRVGPRIPGTLGGIVVAIGFLWTIVLVGETPHYLRDFLPGQLLAGAGVGLVIPSIPAASTAPLPPQRFATGTAVFGVARQIGVAIGIAILVAILGDAQGQELLSPIKDGWAFIAGTGVVASFVFLWVGPAGSRAHEPSPDPGPEALATADA
jgi:EmrB/QacA subfamily drug resistance transporter